MRDNAAAGARNTRAEFQQNSPTTADDGQTVASWSTRFRRWIALIPRGGTERWVFEQVRPEIDHVIHADYDSQLASMHPATWRAKIGSRTLNIDAIFDPDGTRKTLRIFATEVLT